MNETDQLKTIIKAAKVAPKKIGVLIDNHKEERFLKTLRANLPADQFEITCKQLATGIKTIFIERIKAHDPSNN